MQLCLDSGPQLRLVLRFEAKGISLAAAHAERSNGTGSKRDAIRIDGRDGVNRGLHTPTNARPRGQEAQEDRRVTPTVHVTNVVIASAMFWRLGRVCPPLLLGKTRGREVGRRNQFF